MRFSNCSASGLSPAGITSGTALALLIATGATNAGAIGAVGTACLFEPYVSISSFLNFLACSGVTLLANDKEPEIVTSVPFSFNVSANLDSDNVSTLPGTESGAIWAIKAAATCGYLLNIATTPSAY